MRDTRKSPKERGYDQRWRKARALYLLNHPLCVYCAQIGRTTAATVVDHITPHKGNQALFWDEANNWQALCAACHSKAKQLQETHGRLIGASVDGSPVDKRHHWHS